MIVKRIYLKSSFYSVFGFAIFLMALSYIWSLLFSISLALLLILIIASIVEVILLLKIEDQIEISRTIVDQISLGDVQEIEYQIANDANTDVQIEVYDELPYQLQIRSKLIQSTLEKRTVKEVFYPFKPTKRGLYEFGKIVLLIGGPLRLTQIKKDFLAYQDAKVIPSILQMKRYAIQIFSQTASMYGIRNIRTLGENDEFEHIRSYQQGDNIKSINWKATSRRGKLLVNQFQDTRSQMIYFLIDKGRNMEMPFEGLSLLDYSINSTLVIANIVLQKYDKPGLITFSDTIDTFIKANNNARQLDWIIQQLYKEETNFKEPNYEHLYYTCRSKINRRSIIFLFSNFETKYDLDRNIDYLKMLAKKHLLIVISFKNTELLNAINKEAKNIEEIYHQTIAKDLHYEKEKIMKDLRHYGIQTIFTSPQDLSINLINKYLEIKAKQMK